MILEIRIKNLKKKKITANFYIEWDHRFIYFKCFYFSMSLDI